MIIQTWFRYWIAATALAIGLSSGRVFAYTTNATTSASFYTVSNNDLLQTNLRSVESTLTIYREHGFLNGTFDTLMDGTAAGTGNSSSYALSGGAIVYTLNTDLHPSGYTISSINTYTGWGDRWRVNQNYTVSFRQVGSNTFSNDISISYIGTNTQTCVTISDIGLSNVEALRFTFPTQQNSGVGYKEFDVFGSTATNVYTVTGTGSNDAFAVADNDLLQTSVRSADDRLGYLSAADFTNAGAAALTNGTFGSADKTDGTCGITNGVITYLLDTSASPAGYHVTEIDSYSGWDDATRDDQRYTVSFRKVGALLFTDAIAVDYTGTVSQARVCITNLDIGNVEAVRFAFPDQENGGAGYKELDVIGAPVDYTNLAVTADVQTIASNALANVQITGNEESSGTFTLDSSATVISTLTHSATGGVTAINFAGQTLSLNSIKATPNAGGLTIGTGSDNGTLASAGTTLSIDNGSTNDVAIHAAITNGTFSSSLVKSGTGTLTLDGNNMYSGDTLVKGGTLCLSGGALGSGGDLRVFDGKLLVSGGTAYALREATFTNAAVEQTGGALKSGNNLLVQNSTLRLSGGTSYAFMDWRLGLNGTNTTLTVSGCHTSDCTTARLESGTVTMNLLTGGVLYASQVVRISTTASALFFDGGTLGVGSRETSAATNSWINSNSGSLPLYVKNGGAILDTANADAVLRLPLLQSGSSSGGLTKTGKNTLTLSSTTPCTYAGDTVVAAGTLKLTPLSMFANAGFEQPVYGSSGWSYLNTGGDGVAGGWFFSSGGIARNGSPWVKTSPEGYQVGFLQTTSRMLQTNTVFQTGMYQISFSGSSRYNYKGADQITLKIDGVPVGVWETNVFDNAGLTFSTFTTTNLLLTAGSHEFSFSGVSPDGADRATAIDDVQLLSGGSPLMRSQLPAYTRLTVAIGATLDLNGTSPTAAELNGGGAIINNSTTNVHLLVGSDNASTLFSGSIQGNIALTKTGTGTLTLSGSSTFSNATQVLSGTLKLSATSAVSIVNSGFEMPVSLPRKIIGSWDSGCWSYLTSDGVTGGWTMSGNAGIASNASAWVATAPEGLQVGFIQSTSYIQQTITISHTGTYALSFKGANRPGMGADRVTFMVDGASLAVWETNAFANGSAFFTYSTNLTLTAGARLIRFSGTSPDGTDRATAIDDVHIDWAGDLPPGPLPDQTALELASGATLDLNGTEQTLTGLTGCGLITNGAVIVSGIIAPGGTNVIGTLTLAASAALSGTLLIDVAPNGVSDLLNISGNLDLSNLTLQIQDTDLLQGGTPYVIAKCQPGGLINRFISTNVGTKRSVCYDNATGCVMLVGSGTLISIR